MKATEPYMKLAALGMIFAPITATIAAFTHPKNEHDIGTQMALVRENVDLWYIAHIVNFATVALLIGAVVGITALVRRHHPRLALAGGTLSLLGLLGTASYVATHGFVTWRAATAADPAAMTPFLEHFWAAPGVLIPILGVGSLLGVGTALLAYGLYDAKIAPARVAVPLALAPPFLGLGSPELLANNLMVRTSAIFLLLSLGVFGISLLRGSGGMRSVAQGVAARPAERSAA